MRKELGTFILLVVLCIVLAVLNPSFVSGVNLQNLARLIGIYGIFSIGLGLVIITGGIDLSVGSVFALLGCAAVDLSGRMAFAGGGRGASGHCDHDLAGRYQRISHHQGQDPAVYRDAVRAVVLSRVGEVCGER